MRLPTLSPDNRQPREHHLPHEGVRLGKRIYCQWSMTKSTSEAKCLSIRRIEHHRILSNANPRPHGYESCATKRSRCVGASRGSGCQCRPLRDSCKSSCLSSAGPYASSICLPRSSPRHQRLSTCDIASTLAATRSRLSSCPAAWKTKPVTVSRCGVSLADELIRSLSRATIASVWACMTVFQSLIPRALSHRVTASSSATVSARCCSVAASLRLARIVTRGTAAVAAAPSAVPASAASVGSIE